MVTTPNDNNNNLKGLLSGWGLSRPCESCTAASALVYCRMDATFLCGSCVRIHVTLTDTHTPHECVWICEVCEQAPAVVTCKADAAALCSSCDHDIHSANPLASRHERIPVTPILDSPTHSRSTVGPASSSFLVADDLDSVPLPVPTPAPIDDPDTWLIPNPSSSLIYNDSDMMNFGFVCQNLVKPSDIQEQQDIKPSIIVDENIINYTFTSDSVVPTQSQGTSNNFNTNSSTDFSLFENCFNIDFTQPNKLRKKNHHHNNNNNNNLFNSSFNYSAHQSVSSSDIGVVPEGNANSVTSEVSYSFAKSTAIDTVTTTGAPPAMDREARVLRYREKRKNRKFEKTIRYASRKAYAETRPRVKGRFAKRTDQIETSELDFTVDQYGVVPAF